MLIIVKIPTIVGILTFMSIEISWLVEFCNRGAIWCIGMIVRVAHTLGAINRQWSVVVGSSDHVWCCCCYCKCILWFAFCADYHVLRSHKLYFLFESHVFKCLCASLKIAYSTLLKSHWNRASILSIWITLFQRLLSTLKICIFNSTK